jgi:hypothetical protein
VRAWRRATGYDDPETLDSYLGRAGIDHHFRVFSALDNKHLAQRDEARDALARAAMNAQRLRVLRECLTTRDLVTCDDCTGCGEGLNPLCRPCLARVHAGECGPKVTPVPESFRFVPTCEACGEADPCGCEVRRLREALAALRDRFAREEAECRASANRPGLSGTADWDTGAARAYEEARLAVMRALAGGEPKP